VEPDAYPVALAAYQAALEARQDALAADREARDAAIRQLGEISMELAVAESARDAAAAVAEAAERASPPRPRGQPTLREPARHKGSRSAWSGLSGSGGRPHPAEAQKQAAAAAAVHQLTSAARAVFAVVARDFRMTLDAIRETCDVPHLNPDAIGANVWQEAATSQLCQRGGYEILRESAIAAAAGSGKGASLAVAALGSGFDMGIADAIRDGLIMIHISPLELALGYIHTPSAAWIHPVVPEPPALAAKGRRTPGHRPGP
jgi:hypothetical protein